MFKCPVSVGRDVPVQGGPRPVPVRPRTPVCLSLTRIPLHPLKHALALESRLAVTSSHNVQIRHIPLLLNVRHRTLQEKLSRLHRPTMTCVFLRIVDLYSNTKHCSIKMKKTVTLIPHINTKTFFQRQTLLPKRLKS